MEYLQYHMRIINVFIYIYLFIVIIHFMFTFFNIQVTCNANYTKVDSTHYYKILKYKKIR